MPSSSLLAGLSPSAARARAARIHGVASFAARLTQATHTMARGIAGACVGARYKSRGGSGVEAWRAEFEVQRREFGSAERRAEPRAWWR